MNKNKKSNKNAKKNKANKKNLKSKKRNNKNTSKKIVKAMSELKYDPIEGTFYEKMFYPNKITVGHNKEGERTAILEDVNGEKMCVTGNLVVRRLFRTLVVQLTKEKNTANAWKRPDKEATSYLTQIMTDRITGKPEKPPTLKFLINEVGEVEGVSSKIHKQVPWSTVQTILETAIKQAYGVVDLRKDGEQFRWDYRLPIESKYVGAYASIYRGNNLLRGASAVHIQGRFRTEAPDFGGAPACMNWASYALGALTKIFGVREKRLIEHTAPLKMLGARHVHVQKTFADPDKAIEELTVQLKQLENAVIEMNKNIEESIKTPLDINEMKSILWAYDEKVGVPKYITQAIIDRAVAQKEETVWAFSQAISFIRTHGDLHDSKRSIERERRSIVSKLENIAGEVLSLAPTIKLYHEKHGPITFEELIPKAKKSKARREGAMEKAAEKQAITVTTKGAQVPEKELDLSSMSDESVEQAIEEGKNL